MSVKQQSKLSILKFAAVICLICSLLVSVAAVSLRGIQQKNALNEKRINILRAAGLTDKDVLSNAEIDEKFQQIIPIVVDLKNGELDTSKNPNTYDMYAAANDPRESHALEEDPASIKRQADAGSAYVLVKGDEIERVILPVQGYGLWSTLYGFTAISFGNPITISGLTFYQHSETPGLGAEITNPVWQQKWQGSTPYNAQGDVSIRVVKSSSQQNRNEVDSISGATLTSRGVERLMNFWLGESGYAKFIRNIAAGKITANDVKSASNQSRAVNSAGGVS